MPRGDNFKGKGNKPNRGGRKKGVPNKVTQNIRDTILQAFHEAGGITYLRNVAELDPKTFLALVSKVVPSMTQANVSGSVRIVVETGIPASPEDGSSGGDDHDDTL